MQCFIICYHQCLRLWFCDRDLLSKWVQLLFVWLYFPANASVYLSRTISSNGVIFTLLYHYTKYRIWKFLTVLFTSLTGEPPELRSEPSQLFITVVCVNNLYLAFSIILGHSFTVSENFKSVFLLSWGPLLVESILTELEVCTAHYLPVVVVSWILTQFLQFIEPVTQWTHVNPSSQSHNTSDVLVQFWTIFRWKSDTVENRGDFSDFKDHFQKCKEINIFSVYYRTQRSRWYHNHQWWIKLLSW